MSFLLDRVVQVVEVKFDYLDLEAAGGCRYDYVAVYDGPLINNTRLRNGLISRLFYLYNPYKLLNSNEIIFIDLNSSC